MDRGLRLGAALLLVIGVASCVVAFVASPPSYVGWDRMVLLEATGRWIATGSPYPAFQLAGPFTAMGAGNWTPTVLYPPPAMLLFLPFTVLPALAWWAVPLGIVAVSVWRWHPAPWGVALIGVCLANPWTWTLLVWGNATMILAALLALGLRWPAFAPWVLLKPTLAPFALAGIRSRRWWTSAAALALVTVAMLPLWDDWWTSTRNVTNSALTFSLYQVPFMLIPVLAWAASKDHPLVARRHYVTLPRKVRLTMKDAPASKMAENVPPEVRTNTSR